MASRVSILFNFFQKNTLKKDKATTSAFKVGESVLGRKNKKKNKLELQTSFLFRKQCRQTGSFGDAAPKKRRDYYLLWVSECRLRTCAKWEKMVKITKKWGGCWNQWRMKRWLLKPKVERAAFATRFWWLAKIACPPVCVTSTTSPVLFIAWGFKNAADGLVLQVSVKWIA